MVSTGRDLEYKRLRKERLTEGFTQLRKLTYFGYEDGPTKLITGLKGLAEEIRLQGKYFDVALAARADLFNHVFNSEENTVVES